MKMSENLFCPPGHRWSLAAALLVAGMAGPQSWAAIRHVSANLATGADNGSSWANAYRGTDALARAITAATSGDEIWVAAGTYKPTAGTTRTVSFTLKTGVAIYAGFAGTESTRDERNAATNVCTLSGDLGGNDPVITDNSYHLISCVGATQNGSIDGFTITAGNADGSSDFNKGGGIIFLSGSTASVSNCHIVSNRCTFGGGGSYIRGASPTFVDCTWGQNQGGSFGGAIDMANNCNPTFTRCAFIGNTAVRAGGVEVFGTSLPQFFNCIFRNNVAGNSGGGGLWVGSSSTATLRHCTIVGNSTTASGSGILSNSSQVRLYNSIVYSNTGAGGTLLNQLAGSTHTVTYSCVQNGFAGAGNISADPLLVNTASGDVHLLAGSPCIDAANNTESGAGNTLDFDRNPRFIDDADTADTGVSGGTGGAAIADMGAYEFQPETCAADFDADGFVTGLDYDLFVAAFEAGELTADFDGDGFITGVDFDLYVAAFEAGC